MMLNLKKLFSIICIALSAATVCAQGFDYKVLLNPENFKKLDTTYYARGKRIADISYDGISLEARRKYFNMNIPSTVVFKNLKLRAYAKNIDQTELDRLKIKIPLYIISEDGFSITIEGKKREMKLTSNTASLNTDNSITLKGNVILKIGDKTSALGKEATISLLDDRILMLESLPRTFKTKF